MSQLPVKNISFSLPQIRLENVLNSPQQDQVVSPSQMLKHRLELQSMACQLNPNPCNSSPESQFVKSIVNTVT